MIQFQLTSPTTLTQQLFCNSGAAALLLFLALIVDYVCFPHMAYRAVPPGTGPVFLRFQNVDTVNVMFGNHVAGTQHIYNRHVGGSGSGSGPHGSNGDDAAPSFDGSNGSNPPGGGGGGGGAGAEVAIRAASVVGCREFAHEPTDREMQNDNGNGSMTLVITPRNPASRLIDLDDRLSNDSHGECVNDYVVSIESMQTNGKRVAVAPLQSERPGKVSRNAGYVSTMDATRVSQSMHQCDSNMSVSIDEGEGETNGFHRKKSFTSHQRPALRRSKPISAATFEMLG